MVTGACGRIGRHVVRQLLERGIEVGGSDVGASAARLGDLAGRVEVEATDVRDLAALVQSFRNRRVSRVVHLAARFGQASDRHPRSSMEVNLGGTLSVLEAAQLCGVERVVMASSHSLYPPAAGVHGPPEWEAVGESCPADPARPYTIMKLACEQLGRFFARRCGVEFAAVRFSSFYGAERAVQRGNSLSDALNRMIIDALEGIPVRFERGGEQVFDPVYIKDCAHGVVCALLADRELDGRIYNIGGWQAGHPQRGRRRRPRCATRRRHRGRPRTRVRRRRQCRRPPPLARYRQGPARDRLPAAVHPGAGDPRHYWRTQGHVRSRHPRQLTPFAPPPGMVAKSEIGGGVTWTA